jgi:hypothetical protein
MAARPDPAYGEGGKLRLLQAPTCAWLAAEVFLLVRSESVFICANRADDLFAQKIKEEEVIMVGTLARLQLGAPSSEQTPDDEPPLRAHDASSCRSR